jgi:hypothetical protein
MERIKVKFYRVTKYTDPTGMFRIKMELGLMGEEVMGKLTTECDNFPTVTTIMGPFDPIKLMELETQLREEEKKGRIKNLQFEDEVMGVGVKIKINSEQVGMN